MGIIPTPISMKYWHDKTINTGGWWRLLPLVGLAFAALAAAVFWVVKTLVAAYQDYRETQKGEAALDSIRVAVDPTYKQLKADNGWVKDAIREGLAVGAEQDESKCCTCFEGMDDRPGAQCELHGRYY